MNEVISADVFAFIFVAVVLAVAAGNIFSRVLVWLFGSFLYALSCFVTLIMPSNHMVFRNGRQERAVKGKPKDNTLDGAGSA